MSSPALSVVIPTRNPHRERLREVLAALERQTAPADAFELCIVDNGSTPALDRSEFPEFTKHFAIVREEKPGLLAARLRGIGSTSGRYLVFIDDDTVPDANFVAAAIEFLDARPRIGTAGGKILPRYLAPPPEWIDTIVWLLAIRDNGPLPLEWSASDGGALPNWTPIGAGLLARRAALDPAYLRHVAAHAGQIERISWFGQGAGGVEDKDLVLHSLRAGWATGYCPAMVLTHIIPAQRLQLGYFEKLLPKVQEMWMRTVHAHGFAWLAPVAPWSLPLRKAKAWWSFRAWRSPAHRLRWLASCGCLDGLAAIHRDPVTYPAGQSAADQSA